MTTFEELHWETVEKLEVLAAASLLPKSKLQPADVPKTTAANFGRDEVSHNFLRHGFCTKLFHFQFLAKYGEAALSQTSESDWQG